jgi:hypothetical protein
LFCRVRVNPGEGGSSGNSTGGSAACDGARFLNTTLFQEILPTAASSVNGGATGISIGSRTAASAVSTVGIPEHVVLASVIYLCSSVHRVP